MFIHILTPVSVYLDRMMRGAKHRESLLTEQSKWLHVREERRDKNGESQMDSKEEIDVRD